ncbi:MAG: bifunctional nuclease family protein [Candidatus Omnitrophota bacterium]
MVEVELSKIIIDEKRQEQVIVLKERFGGRLLPIVVGIMEAAAIRMPLAGMNPPRPLTHDLIKIIVDTLEGEIDRVVIDKLRQGTFYAKIIIGAYGKMKAVDARPSDSIALALRTKSPIFVEEEVLDKTGETQV